MSVQRWIHCGLCNNLMANKETKFYHLSCTDVLCRSCMGQTNRGTSCPLCNATIRHFTELGDSMSRREKILYHSAPISFYQIASQTLTFQQKHRKNLVQAILKARDSLRRLDELETQIRQQIVETHKRYENMRRFRRNLQESMRKTVTSSDRRNVDADALCSVATGIISQRRISTSTPFFRPSVTPVQSQRRFSVDSNNLINSVKMSQANYSNDSGIGITPSSDCSIGSSNRSISTSTPKTISPIRPNAISHRRVSVGIAYGYRIDRHKCIGALGVTSRTPVHIACQGIFCSTTGGAFRPLPAVMGSVLSLGTWDVVKVPSPRQS
uniref:RING-type domain-containing protein n=1 Tax=Anopheles minimus TaxID=112268 RepID=A0A182W783_9DIPT